MAQIKEQTSSLLRLVPGLALVVAISLPAVYLNSLYKPVSAVMIAIVAGAVLRNTVGLPRVCQAGQTFSVKKVLRLGIILLGVRLSFVEVLRIGGSVVLLIVVCISLALFLVRFIAIRLGLSERLGILLGVGTSICGVSAIVATSPCVDAKEEETSFAIAVTTLFGLTALIVYPIIGRLLDLPENLFGMWAGLAVNDTSQVVATGFVYGETAGNVATVVKLTRNLFMAPVIFLLSYYYAGRHSDSSDESGKQIDYRKALPLFVLGFAAMAILRTLGVFSDDGINMIKTAANLLIVAAIAGVGLGTDIKMIKRIGLKPFYAGLSAAVLMALMSFALLKLAGITLD